VKFSIVELEARWRDPFAVTADDLLGIHDLQLGKHVQGVVVVLGRYLLGEALELALVLRPLGVR
jgi:hypothetical protein